MKQDMQPIDNFFRDMLSDHKVTPSDAAREAFLKDAESVVDKKRSPGKSPYLFLVIGLIILISGTGLYFGFRNNSGTKAVSPGIAKTAPAQNSSITPSEKSLRTSSPSPSKSVLITTTNSPSDGTTHETTQTHAVYSSGNHKTVTSSTPSGKPVSRTTKQNKQPDPQNNSNAVSSALNSSIPVKDAPTRKTAIQTEPEMPIAVNSPANSDGIKQGVNNPSPEAIVSKPAEKPAVKGESSTMKTVSKEEAKNETKENENNNTTEPQQKSSGEETTREKSHSATPGDLHFKAGVYYSPEWMFNTLEGEKYVNNFGVEGTYHFNRFSVRTGAGVSVTEGTHEVAISYNDYLGQYSQLDSITFNWDADHYNLLPTYYTTNKDVYDSLMKLENSRIKRRYTYLQIPLVLGYDFWTTERFTLGVRTGPIFSLLLSTRQLSGDYDPGKNRIMKVNDITPDRIQTNWQFMAGINFDLLLTRRISFEIEPDVRYYFNSVYEKSGTTRKPWSAGLRAAFLINF